MKVNIVVYLYTTIYEVALSNSRFDGQGNNDAEL